VIDILVAAMDRLDVFGRGIEGQWWKTFDRRGTPIVLLHEGLGSVGLWRDFPAALAARTNRAVFAYSRAGHGSSDPPVLPHTHAFMHEEAREWLPAVLDKAGIARATLLGHSDGASIALIFAATCAARVERLILEAPHVFVEDVSVRSIELMKRSYHTGDLRERLAKHHRDVDAAFHGWNDVWLHPDFRDWNLEEFLPRIACPTLLIQGEQDEYGTVRQIEAIRSQLGGPLETTIIRGCGHSPHREASAQVLAAIASFLVRAP
jgi:pimeloyl-ACP methyl ester carboxylesterase